MTTTERAAAIRAALKAKGISSRAVSVRSDSYSMGSSIDICVKDPNVSLATVKRLAEPHESIRRCEYSGEILSGGNRYVSVTYTSEALDALAARHIAAVEAAKLALEASSENSLIPVGDTGYFLGNTNNGWGLSVWNQTSHVQQVSDAKGAAATIGARLVTEAA